MDERFWAKVQKTDGCWLWTGAVNTKGYGKYALGDGAQRWTQAHRKSYEMAHGPIPEGLMVLHSCDTPSCVRPDHLRAGTNGDNQRDAWARGRRVPAGAAVKRS